VQATIPSNAEKRFFREWSAGKYPKPQNMKELLGAVRALVRGNCTNLTTEIVRSWLVTSDPTAGSLHRAKARWTEAFGACPVTTAIETGVAYRMQGTPEQHRLWHPPMTEEDRCVHTEMTLQFLASGAMVPLSPAISSATSAVGYDCVIHESFCVSKNKNTPDLPYGGQMLSAHRAGDAAAKKILLSQWRVVTDFKKGVNRCLVHEHGTVGRACDLRTLARRGALQATADVRTAYHSLKMQRWQQGLLGVKVHSDRVREAMAAMGHAGCRDLCMAANQFGAGPAGFHFSRALELALSVPRFFQITISTIMDDVWIQGSDREQMSPVTSCIVDTAVTLLVMDYFNFLFAAEKLDIVPEPCKTFGGVDTCLATLTQMVPTKRVTKARIQWRTLLEGAEQRALQPLRSWMSAYGVAMSMSECIPWLRLRILGITILVRAGSRKMRKRSRKADFDFPTQSSDEAIEGLRWLLSEEFDRCNVVDISPTVVVLSIVVDADRRSFGFTVTGPSVAQNAVYKRLQTRWFSMGMQSRDSTKAELTGLILAVMETVSDLNLVNCDLRVITDSSSVESFLRKTGGRSEAMCRIAIKLGFADFLLKRRIRLVGEWRPGTFMISCGVDGASRPSQLHPGELALSSALFFELKMRWNLEPTVDLFASAANTKCAHWVSRRRSPGCLTNDALSTDWRDLSARFGSPLYCFPPMGRRYFSRVWAKAAAEQQPLVLVAPWVVTHQSSSEIVAAAHTPPILFQPSVGSLEYPDDALMEKWLRGLTAANCPSVQPVWAVWNLFGTTGRRSSTPPGPQAALERTRLFSQWHSRHSAPTRQIGDLSFTIAATEIMTFASQQTL
jgi:hypothetical protein